MQNDSEILYDLHLSRGFIEPNKYQRTLNERRKQGWKQEYVRRLRILIRLRDVKLEDINSKDKKHRPLSCGKSISFKVTPKRTISILPCVNAALEWKNMISSVQRDVNAAKVYIDMGKEGYVYLCKKTFGGGSVVTTSTLVMCDDIYDEKYVITSEMPWAIGIGFSPNPLMATGYVVCKARSTQKWNIFYTCDAATTRFGAEHPLNEINKAGGIHEQTVRDIIDRFQGRLIQ